MIMKKIKVLLSGSSGMVGRNLLDHPSMDRFDMLTPNRQEFNLVDFEQTKNYIDRHQPDLIIHAAGRVGGIQANMREPVRFLMDNLDMGRNIVWAARQAGVKRLINLGSSCMYPRNHNEPLTETMILSGSLEPTNEGYALAKVVTAKLCDYISHENSSFQYKTLIPCNLYGFYDKYDPAHSHLIPAIIHKIHSAVLRKEKAVEIWGDGTARREFMYAGDLADALSRAISDFESLPSHMNIGLGYDHSINEYYEAVAAVINYQGEFIHNTDKPVGMARKLLSVEKQISWGWSANHTLRSGIEKTYQYYLKECAK